MISIYFQSSVSLNVKIKDLIGIDTIWSRNWLFYTNEKWKYFCKSSWFCVIFDFWTSDWPAKQKTEETAGQFQKEKITEEHCYHGDSGPNKRLSYEKCFVRPLVDSKANANFKKLNVFMT